MVTDGSRRVKKSRGRARGGLLSPPNSDVRRGGAIEGVLVGCQKRK